MFAAVWIEPPWGHRQGRCKWHKLLCSFRIHSPQRWDSAFRYILQKRVNKGEKSTTNPGKVSISSVNRVSLHVERRKRTIVQEVFHRNAENDARTGNITKRSKNFKSAQLFDFRWNCSCCDLWLLDFLFERIRKSRTQQPHVPCGQRLKKFHFSLAAKRMSAEWMLRSGKKISFKSNKPPLMISILGQPPPNRPWQASYQSSCYLQKTEALKADLNPLCPWFKANHRGQEEVFLCKLFSVDFAKKRSRLWASLWAIGPSGIVSIGQKPKQSNHFFATHSRPPEWRRRLWKILSGKPPRISLYYQPRQILGKENWRKSRRTKDGIRLAVGTSKKKEIRLPSPTRRRFEMFFFHPFSNV